ncbi:hypothetical protein J2X14_000482 [Pantoea alhagi]|nr:hypothetical protein [Pantoea alhagi]
MDACHSVLALADWLESHFPLMQAHSAQSQG